MNVFRPAPRPLFARLILPALIGGLALSIAGCSGTDSGSSTGSSPATSSSKSSSKTAGSPNGVTLKGEGLSIDATSTANLMRGYSTEPVSFRMMSGWVDNEKIALANKETDEAEKRKKAIGSFGILTLQVAAGAASPGTYQLAAEEDAPTTGTVIIDKSEDAGIAHQYTSQSGTLDIKSVDVDDSGVTAKVTAVEGTFDGTFASDDGDTRDFSGSFRFVPKD